MTLCEADTGLSECDWCSTKAREHPKRLLGRAGLAGECRRMFQQRPYSQQEALQLSEREVAAVVAVVCGSSAGLSVGSPSGSPLRYPSSSEGQQHVQMCSVILVKLVMDMWLRAGPDISRPLLLLLLRGCA